MHTMAPNAVAAARAPWARATVGLHHTLSTLVAWPLRRLQGWQAARRRALEFRALRELSPHVLCDIGIPHELIGNVQAWRNQQALLCDSIGRGL